MKVTDAIAISKKSANIDGWLSREAALLIALIDEVQKNNGFNGDIFEIGVHHGKSAVLFTHLLCDNEVLDVCDIFDDQSQNKSKSGDGNKDVFQNHINKIGKDRIGTIYQMLSFKLENENLEKKYRIFHIDGGHETDEALFDLNLAATLLLDHGIIILDDPFRQDWPGVTEALVKFLESHPDFHSFVVGFNKLMICKKEFTETYASAIDDESQRKQYQLHYPIIFERKLFANDTMRALTVKAGMNMRSLKLKIKRIIKS